MNDEQKLEEETLKKAFEGGPVEFVSMEEKEIPVAKSAYMLAVTGAT